TGILVNNATLSAGGALTLTQSGSAGSVGIYAYRSTLISGGATTLIQTGSADHNGIYTEASTLTAGGAMTLSQLGRAGLVGILVYRSSLTAGSDLSLLQAGAVGSGSEGIFLASFAAAANQAGNFASGTGHFVTLKTNNRKLSLSDVSDNFAVTRGKVRIDLGSGTIESGYYNNSAWVNSATPLTLKAIGLDVYYSGATTGNNAKIAVGSGSFTFVNDKRSVTSAVTLTNSTTASDATNGWGTGPAFGASGSDTTLGGLTITGTGGTARLQGLGVAYGGTVDIQGVTAASTTGVNSLRYIEGTGIGVTTAASTFSGGLTLVGNGAGISMNIAGGTWMEGIAILANLSTTNGGDLSLVQTGSVSATGIIAYQANLTTGGATRLQGLGVVYGGTVNIQGVTAAS
ncbi:MAG: hypothetical protein ORO03_05090, partial [Alphaproteobacteria bacterium]|nr:hypothetical protein [Alphaproteobacteria bacterium]